MSLDYIHLYTITLKQRERDTETEREDGGGEEGGEKREIDGRRLKRLGSTKVIMQPRPQLPPLLSLVISYPSFKAQLGGSTS